MTFKLIQVSKVTPLEEYPRLPQASEAKPSISTHPQTHSYKVLPNLSAIIIASPLTDELKKQFEKSVELSHKIEAVKDDDERWLSCLKETDDEKCIIQSIETRIGGKPWNKRMWHLYLQFLKERNLNVS